MSSILIAVSIVLFAASGVPGLFARRGGTWAERMFVILIMAGAIAGGAGVAWALSTTEPGLDLPWPVPGGRLALRIDGIAAMFLLPLFFVGALGSIYGLGYWSEREHPTDALKVRLFYGAVMAGMALLVVARNSILFLAGWEVMALAAFVLVSTEDRDRVVRQCGLVYLVATRLGTLCLFAFFAYLYALNGDFDFALHRRIGAGAASALSALALVGFGIKAGLMPLHVWLPGAHASTPSHVSALMSGVLIKMGIYGLVRTWSFFPHPPTAWGGILVGLGATSGILGVAFAIGQHDIKRLLAYHSVENIGIIVMSLGFAVLGRALGDTGLVVLGTAGALLHVWNHGLFKALLFMSAGSVVHATGTRDIDHLGGLARRMPKTAACFLSGAVAICGLPPLNGFVSELLLYLAMFRAATLEEGRVWLAGAFGAPALALIGALAVACFAKVYGVAFLGTARTDRARDAHESSRSMLGPMAVLVGACAVIGLLPWLAAPLLDRAVRDFAPDLAETAEPVARLAPLRWISAAGALLLVVLSTLALALKRATREERSASAGTWDCGFVRSTPKIQYTASSFGEMLVGFFAWALRPRTHERAVAGAFPAAGAYHGEVLDPVLDGALLPGLSRIARAFASLRWLQQGSVHAYLLYILLALIVGFTWKR